jgi:hypothetical protein
MGKNLRRLLVTLVLLPAILAVWALPSSAGVSRTGASVYTRSSNPGPTQAGEPDGGQSSKDKTQVGTGSSPPRPGAEQMVRWMRWTSRAWMVSSLRSGAIRW